jgi:hypothetical protein
MNSAIFTTGNQSYQVSNVVYAGPVAEIPEERRRNGSTHSFKIVTTVGSSFCYYKDADTARRARGALGAMLDSLYPNAFKHGNEYLDPRSVVSFSNVCEFKKPIMDYTHGFVVTVMTLDEKNREIWLRYREEEHARKGRKVMWAAIHTANGMTTTTAKQENGQAPVAQPEPVAAETVPF